MTPQGTTDSPISYKLRLGQALEQLRQERSLSVIDVARELECTDAAIRQYERGRSSPSMANLETLLDLYDVTDETSRTELLELGRLALRRRKRTPSGASIPDRLKRFFAIEETASRIRYFAPSLIYGLAQTEAYARAIIEGNPELSPAQVDQLVQNRLARQQLLLRDPAPAVVMVFTESVTKVQYGGPEMLKEQLLHLIDLAERRLVEVRIVRWEQPRVVPTAFPFMLFEADSQLTTAYVENLRSGIFIDEPEAVATYEAAFEELTEAALSPADSVELLATVASHL